MHINILCYKTVHNVKGLGENCIMRSFTISTLHEILELSNKGGRKINILENLKGTSSESYAYMGGQY
jgi:hypothetical protein